MKRHQQKLGAWGEKVARSHLSAHGFQIVATNWRCPHGEIDIVTRRKGIWHFVEVKTRRGTAKGEPEEGITARKRLKLMQSALAYIGSLDLDEADWQIDLIAIELDGGGRLIRCEMVPNIVQSS